jgi:hypothetical protein
VRVVGVDLAALGAVTALALVGAHELALMQVLVPLLVVLRFVGWAAAARPTRAALVGEVAFFALCVLLGGGNDWLSVAHHRVYDYLVPSDLGFSPLPSWMLLYWGFILRTICAVGNAAALGLAQPTPCEGADPSPRGPPWWRTGWPRLAIQLALVLATRQAIYRLYAEPLWSIVPFAAALAIYLAVLRPTWPELRFALGVLVLGGAAEVALIQGAGLHRYALGWVPVWIVLWWALGALVWRELGERLRVSLNLTDSHTEREKRGASSGAGGAPVRR